jgi:DNA-binding NarL/FixJ family response regulator
VRGATPPTGQGYILIVDNDADFRAFVSACLAQAGYATSEAVSGEEAFKEAGRERPQLVVLDVCLPGLSGYEICRELKEQLAEVPVLFVSGVRTDPLDRTVGLLVGGDDYLCKPFAADEFLARVRRLTGPPAEANQSPDFALTPREFEVLELLAAGLSAAEIGDELTISARTAATHTEHILRKLGARTRAHAVSLAYVTGLLDIPRRESPS